MRCQSTALLALFAALAGCSGYPRDIEGTLDSVQARHVVRVGLIGNNRNAGDRSLTQTFLARVTTATGASSRIIIGSAEPLLAQLEANQLDLVIGEIAEDSPWITEVAVLEPLAVRSIGDREVGLSPIARNGENQWIALLERLARDQRGDR